MQKADPRAGKTRRGHRWLGFFPHSERGHGWSLEGTVFDELPYLRVYSLCSFDPGSVVPTVELIDAETDADAVTVARSRKITMQREIWDHHRLVATIRPSF